LKWSSALKDEDPIRESSVSSDMARGKKKKKIRNMMRKKS